MSSYRGNNMFDSQQKWLKKNQKCVNCNQLIVTSPIYTLVNYEIVYSFRFLTFMLIIKHIPQLTGL